MKHLMITDYGEVELSDAVLSAYGLSDEPTSKFDFIREMKVAKLHEAVIAIVRHEMRMGRPMPKVIE